MNSPSAVDPASIEQVHSAPQAEPVATQAATGKPSVEPCVYASPCDLPQPIVAATYETSGSVACPTRSPEILRIAHAEPAGENREETEGEVQLPEIPELPVLKTPPPLRSGHFDTARERTTPMRVELTDRASGAAIATLTLLGDSETTMPASHASCSDERLSQGSEPSSPSSGDAYQASVTTRDTTTTAPAVPRRSNVESYPPHLDIRGQAFAAPILIDARNVAIAQLLHEVATRFKQPIYSVQEVTGTVTARLSAPSGIRAIQAILEPLGLIAVMDPEGAIRISTGSSSTTTSQIDGGFRSAEVPVRLPNPSMASHVRTAFDSPQPVDESSSIALVAFVASEPNPSADNSPMNTNILSSPVPSSGSVIGSSSNEADQSARLLLAEGRSAEAIDLLADAIVRNPRQPRLLVLLAQAYQSQGNLEAAQTAIEQSLTFNRTDPDANEVMGRILLDRGQDNRGRHYLQQAQYYRK